MTRVSLLTPGFDSANSQALLYPLLRHRRRLARHGIEVTIFRQFHESMHDADVLAIDSKFLAPQLAEAARTQTLDRLADWREQVGQLIYFETGDSTAIMHHWVLPLVDRFVKGQLLRDRTAYRTAHYGQRLFTDFAHRHHQVEDSRPASSTPIGDPALLAKLAVGWNSGLADYSPGGGWRASVNRRLPLTFLLRAPHGFTAPGNTRDIDVNARFTTNYARETVADMRQRVGERFRDRASTSRVSPSAYRAELQRSRLVLSPFGWGEINLRDYETFIAGAAAVKPDMTHLETWPDLFRSGETIITHRWDLADLNDVVSKALAHPERTAEIAARGQDEYQALMTTKAGAEAFCRRFAALVSGTPN